MLLRLLLLSFSEVRGELGVVLIAFLLSSHMHSQFTALALNKPSSSSSSSLGSSSLGSEVALGVLPGLVHRALAPARP